MRRVENERRTCPSQCSARAVGRTIAAATGTKLVGADATYLHLLQGGCCRSTLLEIIK
ncbi:MAG TPA: hypothetical protein VKZ18_14465 [Polyangia bacterium]|nr:hypothetical protein [Polyangia bacterium]